MPTGTTRSSEKTSGALSVFNMNIPAPRKQYAWGAKGDLQISTNLRLSARSNGYEQNYYSGGGATGRPSMPARTPTSSGRPTAPSSTTRGRSRT